MINLLPPELKRDYIYARQNTQLAHFLVSFGVGIAGLALIVGAGFMYLQQAASRYSAQASATQSSLVEQKQTATEKQVEEISASLKLAVSVLSKEVLFSELIKRLAVITPNNVSLSGVSISNLSGGIDVSADAADYDAATQLQINLADPANKIFSKADIVSITCASDGTGSKKYPCTVVVRALFADDNPFLFINGKTAS